MKNAPNALPGFEAPAVGFDEPFDMLGACHDRVRRTLRLLMRLQAHLLAHGVDEMASQAAKDVLRYFVLAAPQHHHDEELHVVPLLQTSGDTRLMAAAERILTDHTQMAQTWQTLEPLLEAVTSGACPEPAAFASASDVFTGLYQEHLVLEEALVFPAARTFQAARGPDALAAMGEEMARRRRVLP